MCAPKPILDHDRLSSSRLASSLVHTVCCPHSQHLSSYWDPLGARHGAGQSHTQNRGCTLPPESRPLPAGPRFSTAATELVDRGAPMSLMTRVLLQTLQRLLSVFQRVPIAPGAPGASWASLFPCMASPSDSCSSFPQDPPTHFLLRGAPPSQLVPTPPNLLPHRPCLSPPGGRPLS